MAETSEVRFAVRTPFATPNLRERAQLLVRLGYDGIELGHEYMDRSPESILADLHGTGIQVSAIVGSIALLAADEPGRRRGIELTRRRLELARELGAAGVIEVPTFGPRLLEIQEDEVLAAALRQLAPDVERTGVPILLEPLTRKETPFMNLQSHGARVIEMARGSGIRLLSDFYHMHLEEPDVAETLARHGQHTGYVHLADGEDRTYPGSLPFDYRPGFRSLKQHGYRGWLTMEFNARPRHDPTGDLADGLSYVRTQWAAA